MEIEERDTVRLDVDCGHNRLTMTPRRNGVACYVMYRIFPLLFKTYLCGKTFVEQIVGKTNCLQSISLNCGNM